MRVDGHYFTLLRYPVAQFASEYLDVNGTPLLAALRQLDGDIDERPLIDTLADEIASGRLREALRVDFAERQLLDGHHRAAAALRLGAPVWVTDQENEPGVEVEATFAVAEHHLESDRVFLVFRSFRCGTGWAQADVMSSHRGTMHACYTLVGCDEQQLADTVRQLAGTHGLHIGTVETHPAEA